MRKALTMIMMALFILLPLNSIGFGYHVLDINTSPNFSIGGHFELPVSVVYQFNFPMPDFVRGSATVLAFRLDNGLDFRELKQDPVTGNLLKDSDNRFPERDYMTMYDEFNLEFSQGLMHLDFSDEDLITLKISVDGRFENAYESLDYFSSKDNREGLFHTISDSGIINRSPFSGDFLSGTPELSGSRSVFQLSFSAGLDINLMRDDETEKKGFKFSSYFRWTPPWLQFFTDTADFILWKNSLDLAWTFFSFNMTDNLRAVSLMLENKTEYRYVSGEKVPYYATDAEIWEAYALPTEHMITNSTELVLFGPQLGAKDFYPYVSGFFDCAYNFGNVVNSSEHIDGDFIMSYGFRAELIIFNVSTVYYEIGFVSENFGDMSSPIQKFGFRVGI